METNLVNDGDDLLVRDCSDFFSIREPSIEQIGYVDGSLHKASRSDSGTVINQPGVNEKSNSMSPKGSLTRPETFFSSNPLVTRNSQEQVSDGDHHRQDRSTSCPETSFVKINVVKVGIYGWRKKFLYLLILIITALVFINAALLLWIARLLDLSLFGFGTLRITSNGIVLGGDVFVENDLFAKSIKSRQGSQLSLQSTDAIFIDGRQDEAGDEDDGSIRNSISIEKDSVQIRGNQFEIRKSDGSVLFQSDPERVMIASDKLWIKNDLAINFNKSFQSPVIWGTIFNSLQLISPTRSIVIKGPTGVSILSPGGDIQLSSLQDINLRSREGKLELDSETIYLKNLRISQVSSSSQASSLENTSGGTNETSAENLSDTIYQLCVCSGNGRLFMAPSLSSCSTTNRDKICPPK